MFHQKPVKLVICAGGSGGHIYPGICVYGALKKINDSSEIIFFGSGRQIEKEILLKENIRLIQIKSKGFRRDLSVQSVISFFSSITGYVHAFIELMRFKPDVLLSMGGYSSLPAVLAAHTLRIPIVLHEQNVFPGLSNRIAARFAEKIALSFEDSKKYFDNAKIIVTGNPVREEILASTEVEMLKSGRTKAINNLGLDPGKKTVLIVGGSQGARSINNSIIDAVPLLKEQKINILHVCGQKDYEALNEKIKSIERGRIQYKLFPYLDNMADALIASDLVISRAGATMLAEIAAVGRPSILIPYPYASENHQKLNADIFTERGAAVTVDNSLLSGKALSDIMRELINNEPMLKKMSEHSRSLFKNNASEKIAGIIYETI